MPRRSGDVRRELRGVRLDPVATASSTAREPRTDPQMSGSVLTSANWRPERSSAISLRVGQTFASPPSPAQLRQGPDSSRGNKLAWRSRFSG